MYSMFSCILYNRVVHAGIIALICVPVGSPAGKGRESVTLRLPLCAVASRHILSPLVSPFAAPSVVCCAFRCASR